MTTIVIGVGNEFRRDDGAGPAVIDALRGRVDATLAITDGEPARLIELWAGADLAVVVDAVRAKPPNPGRLHELDLETATQTPPSTPASSHALGLGEAIKLGQAVDRLPHRLHIYAIEGQHFNLGLGLSPPITDAVHTTAEHIIELLDQPTP